VFNKRIYWLLGKWGKLVGAADGLMAKTINQQLLGTLK
jgi:hypothetical protein